MDKDSHNALQKFEVDEVLAKHALLVRTNLASGDERFAGFKRQFNEKFPKRDPVLRGFAQASLWAIFGSPLMLYYLGQPAMVIVELHGLLEHYVRRDLPKFLTRDKAGREVIRRRIDRATLKTMADDLRELGVWSESDVSVVKRLAKLRDGVVHNNASVLSKALGQEAGQDLGDARNAVDEIDPAPLLLGALGLLVKIAKCFAPRS